MDLIYKPDFWSFYKANRNEVDRIIIFFSNKYNEKYDENLNIEEMSQEILLRLANSDILTKFDPEKSSLKTYLTIRIRGYTGHILDEVLRLPHFISIELYDYYCDKGDEKQANKLTLRDHIDYNPHPAFNETINNTLYSEEIMIILKKHLDETHYLIACLYLLDCYTCKEISQCINKFSYNTIVKKISKISSLVRKIISSHDNIHNIYHKPVRASC